MRGRTGFAGKSGEGERAAESALQRLLRREVFWVSEGLLVGEETSVTGAGSGSAVGKSTG